jgi:outer membrane receptor protein involved in Fe transport
VYDDVNRFNLHVEVAFFQKVNLVISLKPVYFKIDPYLQPKAWYKPELQVGLYAKYNLQEKIMIHLDLFNISSQYAQVTELDQFTGATLLAEKKLKGVTDVNLGAEYRYNKKLSAFVNFNNIASMRYYRWYNYPSQKFSLMAGVTFSF